jgi:hypothetical protein
VSVTAVTRPLLGPPHTHTVGGGTEGVRLVEAALMGDVTPESDPQRYKMCVSRVAERVLREAAARKVPVLVNSCGWVKGLGLELLTHLLAVSAASLVLVSQVGNPRKDIPVTCIQDTSRQRLGTPNSKRAAKRRAGNGTFDSNATPLGTRGGKGGGGRARGGGDEDTKGRWQGHSDGDGEEDFLEADDDLGVEEEEEEADAQVPWAKDVQVLPITRSLSIRP